MAKVKYTHIVDRLTTSSEMTQYILAATKVLGKKFSDTSVSFEATDKAYCSVKHRGTWGRAPRPAYDIVVGTHLSIKHIFNATPRSSIDPKNLKQTLFTMRNTQQYLLLHECGHVKYTAMKSSHDWLTILQDKGYNLFAFIFSQLSNIIEDIVLEEGIASQFSWTERVIRKGQKDLFPDSCGEEFADGMNDSVESLLQYLLLICRIGKKNIPVEHTVYATNSKEISKTLVHALKQRKSVARLEVVLSFAWEIYCLYNEDEYKYNLSDALAGKDKAWIDSLPKLPTPEDAPKDPIAPGHTSSSKKELDPFVEDGVEEADGSGGVSDDVKEDAGESTEESAGDAPDEIDGGEASLGGGGKGASPFISEETIIKQTATDAPIINFPHKVVELRDHLSHYDDAYEEILKDYSKYSSIIQQCVKEIKKLKATNYTRPMRGQRHGELDMRRAMNPKSNPIKVFKKRRAPQPEADLFISLLVDNSGSMCGKKTVTAYEATLVFAYVCYLLKIPFEIHGFTEGRRQAVTQHVMGPKDKFQDRINDILLFKGTGYVKGCTCDHFAGNVDEANIDYVYNNLDKYKQKDKLLIVISDGATCGSKRTLGDLTNHINKSIATWGIGIYSSEVEDLYTNSWSINNDNDLNKLPSFMARLVAESVFK